MSVKVFLGTIILLAVATVTGFAYWFFPILNKFHQQMGGAPLKDPRGDWQQQADTWMGYLPGNTFERAVIVSGIVVGYLFITTMATLIAIRFDHRRKERAIQDIGRRQVFNSYNMRRS